MSNSEKPAIRVSAMDFEITLDKMLALEQMIPEVVADGVHDEFEQRIKCGVRALLREVNKDMVATLDTLYAHEFATDDTKKKPLKIDQVHRLTVANATHA